MRALLFSLILASNLAADPQPPYSVALNKSEIQSIPIHTEIDTLLIFPHEVATIIGNGLTSSAEISGSVLYQQGQENPKTIVLRHLDGKSRLLMTVMIGDDAFVFRLDPSPSPASVIHLTMPGTAQPGREITAKEATLRSRPMSEERRYELLRLARESESLREKIPQEYRGYTDRDVRFVSTRDSVTSTITHIAQFANEGVLTLSGTMENTSDQLIDTRTYSGSVRVGIRGFFPPKILMIYDNVVAPGEITRFEVLLIGDGEGKPLKISLENEFSLYFAKNR